MTASYPRSLLNFRGALLNALIAKGYEVHVAAPKLAEDSEFGVELVSMGLHVHELSIARGGLNPLIDFVTLCKLWLLMRRIKPDVTLSYTIKPVIYGGIASWLAGVPNRFALITGLGYAFTDDGRSRIFVRWIVQKLYRLGLSKTQKVFFQNPDDKRLFYTLKIVQKSKNKTCLVNGSGVDLDKFIRAPFPRTIKFLMIARLLGDKGIREFVQSAKLVRRRFPEVKFGVVGWIDDNPDSISFEELQAMIDAGDVEFHGRLSDVRPAIMAASVYVLPSYREGTPRTVLEAMAMGRPIVTTNAPGCRETVIHGKNGFLVPIKDAGELAEAMFRFVEMPGLIAEMGKCSRKLVENKYDVHEVNKVMLREMEIR